MKKFSRLVVMALIASSVVPLRAQDLERRVTYQTTGRLFKDLVKELEPVTGFKFAYPGQAGQHAVILSVKDVPAKEVFERIGKCLDLKVTFKEGLVDFQYPAYESDPNRQYKARLEQIKKFQELARKELESMGQFSEQSARELLKEVEDFFAASSAITDDQSYFKKAEGVGQNSPITKLGYVVFTSLDPAMMASIAKGKSVVLSTQPTRMQKQLPQSLSAQIQTVAKDLATWKRVTEGRSFKYPENRGMPSHLYGLLQGRFEWDEPAESQASPSDARQILIKLRSHGGTIPNIEIKLVGPDGRYVWNSGMDEYKLSMKVNKEMRAEQEQAAATHKPTLVKVSPVAAEIAKAMSYDSESNKSAVTLSAEAKKKISNPETYDPIGWIFGDAIIAYAESKKINCIVTYPDLGFAGSPLAEDRESIDLGMLKMFERFLKGALVSEETNKWYAVNGNRQKWEELSAEMAYFKWECADRRPVGAFLRQVMSSGRLTIDALAAYAAQLETVDDFDQNWYSVTQLAGRLIGGEHAYHDKTALTLYGLLNPAQRREMQAGKPVPLSNTSQDFQNQVLARLFGGESYEIRFEPSEGEAQDQHEKFYNGIYGEPTFMFANGLPRDSRVTLMDQTQTQIRCWMSENGNNYIQNLDPNSLGSYLALAENPTAAEGFTPPTFAGFQPVKNRTIILKIYYTPTVYSEYHLNEFDPVGTKVDALNQLPKDILKEVMDAKAAAAEGYKNPPGDPPKVKR